MICGRGKEQQMSKNPERSKEVWNIFKEFKLLWFGWWLGDIDREVELYETRKTTWDRSHKSLVMRAMEYFWFRVWCDWVSYNFPVTYLTHFHLFYSSVDEWQITPNLAAWNNKYLLYHQFWLSRNQEQLGRVPLAQSFSWGCSQVVSSESLIRDWRSYRLLSLLKWLWRNLSPLPCEPVEGGLPQNQSWLPSGEEYKRKGDQTEEHTMTKSIVLILEVTVHLLCCFYLLDINQ